MRLESAENVASPSDGLISDPDFRQLLVVVNSRPSEFELQLPSGKAEPNMLPFSHFSLIDSDDGFFQSNHKHSSEHFFGFSQKFNVVGIWSNRVQLPQ